MIYAVEKLLRYGVQRKLRQSLSRLLQVAKSCQDTQHQTLQRILGLNRDSDFSRDHGLNAVGHPRELQRALPVGNYERVAPYIEQVKQGRCEALLGPRNRPLMFALTSGTTNSSKFIPVTKQFLADYRRGWQVWGIRAFDAHPILHRSSILQICSDYDKFRTPTGIPCGNISGLVQSMHNRVIQRFYAVPAATSRIPDSRQRLYATLLHSLKRSDLGLITTANPSTLVQLFRVLREDAESLIRDLHDGVKASRFPDGSGVAPDVGANPRRARELEQLFDRTGQLAPREVWPQLQLAAVWTGGTAAAYLPMLRRELGDLPICDHGLHASEGRMTIPLEDETSSGLLDIQSHFFEFIPESEHGSDDPVVLLPHELEVHQKYYIVLTTCSGLVRYDILDVVECTGFLGTTPLLKFLHKGSHISNLTGEKLTELHVLQCVSEAVRRFGFELGEFTVAPRWGDPPGYVMLLNRDELPVQVCRDQLGEEIDRLLGESNVEYQEKRRTGRLASLSVEPVPEEAWSRYVNSRYAPLGGSIEQAKHCYLVPRLEFVEEMTTVSVT